LRLAADGYISRRILSVLPVWLGLSLLSFSLANLAPGDPAELILRQQTGESPSAEAVRNLRHEMGLDRPFAVRYGQWLGDAARGDLGVSYSSGSSVVRMLAVSSVSTLELAFASLFLGILLGVPAGVVAAVKRGKAVDHFSRILSLLGTSVPSFVLGYLLILFLSVRFNFFPANGSGDWTYLVLPALTLGLGEGAALARLTRASMIDVLGEAYIRTAHAKGSPPRRVFLRHALRNALNPVVTLTGLRLGRLLGGAIIVEIIFARAGLGTVIVDAIQNRDYSVIQGFILFVGSVFVVANLLVDIIYARLDPRIVWGRKEVSRASN